MYFSKDFSQRQKQTLDAIPWTELAEQASNLRSVPKVLQDAIDSFSETYGLKHKPWLYHQLLAHVARWSPVRGPDGLLSAREMLRSNLSGNPVNQGIYYFLMSDHRALAKQSSPEGLPFCALVPLILAAHKKINGLGYSEWNREEASLVINPALYKAATTAAPNYTTEEILTFRTIGLTVKSGDKAGTVKSPVHTYGLNGLPWVVSAEDDRAGPGQLPQLLRMMICQTWCAHPQNRNSYMILDPVDWDRMPPALVDSNPVPTSKPVVLDKLPWE